MSINQIMPVMIVAGEASGDRHAAHLVEALRAEAPHIKFEFFGATGKHMRDAGVESIVDMDELALVGIAAIGRALPRFWTIYKQLQRIALERQPRACILVDYPEFNLRLARALHRQGLKTIYYISPQLWAWRSARVRYIREDVDLLLAVLPFEPAWYEARGVRHVEFVGHPLTGEVRATRTREEFCRAHNLDASNSIIALLPGSRRQEIAHHLLPMIEAAQLLQRTHANAQFVVAVAPNRSLEEVMHDLNVESKLAAQMRFVHAETYDALASSDVAVVASGTATLETAMIGTPPVIVYRGSAFNWHTLGRLIEVEHIGLINLIAGERIAPELIQNDFTSQRVAHEIAMLLEPARNAAMREQLRHAVAQLGTGGASTRAAQAIINALDKWKRE